MVSRRIPLWLPLLGLPLSTALACGDDGGGRTTAATLGTDTSGPSTETTDGTSTSGTETTTSTTTDPTESTGGTDSGNVPPDALIIGGPNADYPDFTSAIADWEGQTVPDGGLLFSVTAGDYDERIVVPSFDGASAANPVEFRVFDGSAALVGAGSAADDEAMIRFESTDWVTFDGVSVRDDSGMVELGFQIVGSETDGATNNVLRNLQIQLSNVAATRGIRMESGMTMSGSGGTNDDNLFENLDIDRVGSGIQLLGPQPDDIFAGPLYDDPDTGNAVVGCTFGATDGIGHSEDNTSFAINVSNQADLEIADNVFVEVSVTDSAPVVPAGASAISLDAADGSIVRNRIERVSWSGTGGSAVTGIRATVTPTGTLNVTNNFVSGLSRGTDYVSSAGDNSLYARGIWIFKCFTCDAVTNVANVAHNTVDLSLESGRSYPIAAFELSGGTSGQVDAVVQNNILRVEGLSDVATGLAYAIVDGNTERTWLDNDGNVLWATGPGAVLGQIGRELGGTPAEAADLTAWQNISSGDATASEADVEFANAAAGDLHLSGASTSDANLQKTAFGGISDDIDGDARGAMPFAGADEP